MATKDAPAGLEAAVRLHEYTSAVNPDLPGVPAVAVGPGVHTSGPTRVVPVDSSAALGATPWPATSPNLLASFVRIVAGEALETRVPRATSQAFYVIRGAGATEVDGGGGASPATTIAWGEGDLFVLPATPGAARHTSSVAAGDASLYWIHDEPLLRYLGAAPSEPRFSPTLYTRERLLAAVEAIRHEPGVEHRNRMGVLLSNASTDGETKTLTHVMWALLNSLPPRTAQPPHRHNSVALDLAVAAAGGGRVYTLMGPELGADGWVKDPLKMEWVPGGMFVTPPGECCGGGGGGLRLSEARGRVDMHGNAGFRSFAGRRLNLMTPRRLPLPRPSPAGWWHSHHNESDEPAWVLPIQDAGLYTRQRTLDIRFSPLVPTVASPLAPAPAQGGGGGAS